MNYQEQLLDLNWQLKRISMMHRDKYRCVNCGVERPVLRNLKKDFGIKTLGEMTTSGYELISSFISSKDNKYLTFKNTNYPPQQCDYLGNSFPVFDQNTLRFALQMTDINPFDFRTKYKLICFLDSMLLEPATVDLNIHHKYYVQDKKAWEYDNDALITLCINCHQKEHEENEIFVYSAKGEKLYTTEICPRCWGSGYLERFYYYMDGVCFSCSGEGVIFDDYVESKELTQS